MSTLAVVPGSFDPVTLGHLDVIRRAALIFDEVHVLVVHNPGKNAMLPISERVNLLQMSFHQDSLIGSQQVTVASCSVGLLFDFCTEVGSKVLVKGLLSQNDVADETPMVLMNRSLAGVETVFLLPEPAHSHVSSSLVRQVASLGGDVSDYVPTAVAKYLDSTRPA